MQPEVVLGVGEEKWQDGLKEDVLSVVEEEVAADDFCGGLKEGVGLAGRNC